jgi:hypothetical protein
MFFYFVGKECIFSQSNSDFGNNDKKSSFSFFETSHDITSILRLDFPLFTLPYQIDATKTAENRFFGSYATPSMSQSLAISVDAYSAIHFGMRKMYDSMAITPLWKNIIYIGGTAAGILAFIYIPFGYQWMHIEFQRSILTHHGHKSSNFMYNLQWWNGYHEWGIKDEDMIELKNENSYDAIRFYEAGTEGYILFSDHMLRNIFFYDLNDLSNFTALLSVWFGALRHVGIGLAAEIGVVNVDKQIEDMYNTENSQNFKRPYAYAGLNWVYDLFRPDEPFSTRGVHPSGNGIARSITLSQLSEEEQDYLVKQGWLSFLNFLSPLFYFVNRIPLGKSGYDWNFALRHYLTSFGADVPVQFLLKKVPLNMIFTWHNYMNYGNYYTAIEAELADFPFTIGGFTTYLSPRVLIGIQPKDQVFKTGEAEFLGLIGLRADFAVSKYVLPYFELTAKTDGWVAGNEYLNRNISCVLGVSVHF